MFAGGEWMEYECRQNDITQLADDKQYWDSFR